ncbi:MAG TPA: TetR/AcrR family transcriptional regulator [Solirubrobacteraceae bacterium]|jgi:AcrR family transcriptional regulator|nr:TetR/AcrR family transcriptional regulator [Solirubrobacteraceae bacterium]
MPAKRPSARSERRTRAPRSDGFGRDHIAEIQRARIVAAMIDVVSERSRANATVAHVVTRSGVSRRTFYELFDDFEDCFLAGLDQSVVRISQYVRDVYDPTEKWRTRLRSALMGVLEFLDDEPAMGRLCIVETLGAGSRVYERRLAVLDVVVAVVDEGRKEPRSATMLPPLTGEGVVGGVLSVLHTRLLPYPCSRHGGGGPDGTRRVGGQRESLLYLTGALMGMIVLPYLGPAAAAKEAARPTPGRRSPPAAAAGDPLRGLEMRLTYRTVRVLLAIAAKPDASNREVGVAAGIGDQGQISKLLSRLEKLELVHNSGGGQVRGAPNAWSLTKKGLEVERLVAREVSLVAGV